jgi:predicted phosphohydrolase
MTHFSEMKSDKNLSSNRVLALQTKQCFVFAHIPPLNMATSMSPHDSKTVCESKIQKTVYAKLSKIHIKSICLFEDKSLV